MAVVRSVQASRRHVALLVLLAAGWGMFVDGNLIPVLAPTTNSTIFQASTAAFFAVIGILFGPIPGALAGLVRDSSGHVLTLLIHPGLSSLEALGRAIPDILEDVVLGLIPGIAGRVNRRLLPLIAATFAAAWLSLPFLEAGNAVVAGRPGLMWTVLTTAPGDWNEPVDPGLTVYALLTAGMAALILTRWASDRRGTERVGVVLLAAGFVMIMLGAHD
ncbi:MAG TPA: hypothetical protein VFB58_17980 [Chloroflexota bacterium]|nr:hypothetical protein [Chloroflexota bacterium]